jgi:hypothetical protein
LVFFVFWKGPSKYLFVLCFMETLCTASVFLFFCVIFFRKGPSKYLFVWCFMETLCNDYKFLLPHVYACVCLSLFISRFRL